MSDPGGITTLRRRRGSVKESLTKLHKTFKDLSRKPPDDPKTATLVTYHTKRLESLDREFREFHCSIVDLLDDGDETAAQAEQEALDTHDDEMAILTADLQSLSDACSSTTTPTPAARDSPSYKLSSKRLAVLKENLTHIVNEVDKVPRLKPDVCLLHHYEEQLTDIKKELHDVSTTLLSLDLPDDDELILKQKELVEIRSLYTLKVKRLLSPSSDPSSPSTLPPKDSSNVKLPKLEVPSFSGNVLHWQSFWERFTISVHEQPSLSDTEKFVYLQQSLKRGSASHVIDGLSHTGDNYPEAIASLRSRYDRPRLIHQAHVKVIIELSRVKDGTGKELRRFHDEVQQHLRALRAKSRLELSSRLF